MNERRTIVVLSQAWAGHIPTYHRLYAEHFRRLGWEVIEVVPPRTWSLARRITRQFDRITRWRGRRAWRLAARDVAEAARAAGRKVDAVFLVFLDQGFLDPWVSPHDVERWFPWPWAGVTNEPSAVRGPVGAFAGRERALAADNCRAVIVTDGRFLEPSVAAWPGRKAFAMPEVADLSAPADSPRLRELRAFAQGRRLVGLVGVISPKKNVEAFLRLAEKARVERPDVAFFIAGDFSRHACPGPERRALAPLLAAAPSNCRVFPEPLADGPEFNAWVAACDVVWVAYRNVFFKSNVLTKAAHFRRPVLVSPARIMAEHTREFNLGEVVDVDDVAATLAALQRVLDVPATGRNFTEFAATQSVARMETVARQVLEALS